MSDRIFCPACGMMDIADPCWGKDDDGTRPIGCAVADRDAKIAARIAEQTKPEPVPDQVWV